MIVQIHVGFRPDPARRAQRMPGGKPRDKRIGFHGQECIRAKVEPQARRILNARFSNGRVSTPAFSTSRGATRLPVFDATKKDSEFRIQSSEVDRNSRRQKPAVRWTVATVKKKASKSPSVGNKIPGVTRWHCAPCEIIAPGRARAICKPRTCGRRGASRMRRSWPTSCRPPRCRCRAN